MLIPECNGGSRLPAETMVRWFMYGTKMVLKEANDRKDDLRTVMQDPNKVTVGD